MAQLSDRDVANELARRYPLPVDSERLKYLVTYGSVAQHEVQEGRTGLRRSRFPRGVLKVAAAVTLATIGVLLVQGPARQSVQTAGPAEPMSERHSPNDPSAADSANSFATAVRTTFQDVGYEVAFTEVLDGPNTPDRPTRLTSRSLVDVGSRGVVVIITWTESEESTAECNPLSPCTRSSSPRGLIGSWPVGQAEAQQTWAQFVADSGSTVEVLSYGNPAAGEFPVFDPSGESDGPSAQLPIDPPPISLESAEAIATGVAEALGL